MCVSCLHLAHKKKNDCDKRHLSDCWFSVILFQADLHGDESSYRKMRLIVEDVQGKECLTNFHGMSLTRLIMLRK